jgi:prepilin-type N-terminal cleavage/methylation domain-containing protein
MVHRLRRAACTKLLDWHKARAAFSLMELSVVIIIVGVIAGVALGLKQSGEGDCVIATKTQMKDIQGAMDRFVIQHERYPLPAVRTAGVEDVKYGREVTLAELQANPNLLDATTPPVTTPPTSSVTIGALPFQALGLAPSYAGDCWGNKFTYAVTTDLTETGKFNQQLPLQTYEGVITVKADISAAPVSVKAAYVVVSHGANALGAVKTNYSSSTGDKKYCSLGSTLDSENCEPSNAVFVGAAYNDGRDAGAKFFDDIIIFSDKKQRSINGVCDNAVPNSCAVGLAINDNGLTACGTARTWICKGSNGGLDASCVFNNPACPVCIADGQPSGGNPTSCCNGDTDNDGVCGNSCTGAEFTFSDTYPTLSAPQTNTIEPSILALNGNNTSDPAVLINRALRCVYSYNHSTTNPSGVPCPNSTPYLTEVRQALLAYNPFAIGAAKPRIGDVEFSSYLSSSSTPPGNFGCAGCGNQAPIGGLLFANVVTVSRVCGTSTPTAPPPPPPTCIADGQPSGGNPASCCNGDSDGNGTCGTQGGCAAGWGQVNVLVVFSNAHGANDFVAKHNLGDCTNPSGNPQYCVTSVSSGVGAGNSGPPCGVNVSCVGSGSSIAGRKCNNAPTCSGNLGGGKVINNTCLN